MTMVSWNSDLGQRGLEEGSEEDRRPARRGLGSAGSLPQVAPSVHSNANDDGDDEIIQQRQHWAAVPNPATYVFGIILAARVLTTFSVVGILYIIMFMVYGFTSMRYRPTLAYVAKMRAVPLSVLILSVLDFVTRMILQIAFASGAEVARPGDEMSALELCGFSELTDNVEWARYLAPQILLIFASIREYSRCNDLVAHAKREHPLFFEPDIREATGDLLLGRQITKRTIFFHDNLLGMVFLPEGIREESTEAGGRILNPVRYSRIGTHKILAAIWIVIAGLAWPSLLSLPYTAIIIGAVVRWARMDFSPLKPIYYRLLQLYTMGAGTLLYLWQIDSIQSKLPTAMGLGLGLYDIESGIRGYQLAPRVLHAMAVCGLFVSIGALASRVNLWEKANKQARSVSRDAMSEDDLPEIGTELLIVEAEDFMEDLAYDLGMGTRHILTLLPGQVLEAYAMITRKWGGPAVEAPNAASSLAEDGRGGVSDTGVVSTHNNVARGPSDGLLVDRTQFERGDGPAGSQRGDLAAALATEFADNGQRSPAVRPLSHAFSTPPLRETDLIFDSEAVATPSNRGGGRLSPLLSPRPRATRQPSSILSPRHGLVRNVSLPVAPSPPAAKPPLMPRPLDGIKESPNPKADTEKKQKLAHKLSFITESTVALLKEIAKYFANHTVDDHIAWLEHFVETQLGRTNIASVVLCVVPLLLPSLISFIPLAIGLSTFAISHQWGTKNVEASSRVTYVALLVWFAVGYAFTALRKLLVEELPRSNVDDIDLAHSIGVFSFDENPPAMVPLLGILGMAFMMATVARKTSAAQQVDDTGDDEDGLQGARADDGAANQVGEEFHPLVPAPAGPGGSASGRGEEGSMRRGSGSESGSVVRHGSDDEDHGRHPWTAVDDDPAPGLRPNHPAGARGSGSHAPRFRNLKVDVDPAVLAADERSGFAREETGRPQDSEGKRESDDERKARQLKDLMSLLVSMFIWVLVYAGLPIALFAVGVAHNDVLHAMYVAYVLKILWVGVFEFVPKFERRANLLEIFTAGTVSQHTVLRVYAALHVLVMFAFKMPTLCGILNTPADLIYSGKLETECYTYGSTSTVAANTPEDGAGDAAADGGGDESEHERSIRLFGLWDPQPFGDMLPVLLILLLATWHAHNDQSRMHLFTDFLKKLSSTFATNGPSTAPASARFPPPVSQLSPVRSGEAYEPPAPSTHSRGRDSARTVVPVESGVGVEAMNKVQEALIKLAGHVATSYGVVGVVLVTYIMVVVNVEPGCVLGLGYLALISAMVILPPLVRASIAAKMGSPQDANPHHSPRSGKLRWAFVTCLGLYALADFLTQYALAFPLRVQYLEMSRGTEEDLRTTWGFLPLNEGWDLFKMLLRPTLIMWSLTLYRMGYKVGMSIKMTGRIKGPLAAGRDAEEADRELDKHATLTFTMRRFFIRNRVNMLILFCFFDAVRNPGVLGLCFVVLFAVAILSYVLVGRRSAAAAVSLSGRMSGAGVWLIRTYAVVTLLMLWILQLDVLREGLLDTSSRALLWFNWLGLPATDFDVSAGFSLRKESPDMEQVLRPKALLVAFVGIEVAAVRWLASLPEPIKAEGAKSGQPCALFWPPIGAQLDSVEQQLEEELKKPDMGILSVSLWQRLHRRLKPFIEAVKVQFRSTDAGDEAARSRTELGGPRELGATLADRITPRDLPPPQRPGRRSVDDGPYRKPFSMGRELSRELTDPAHGRAGSSPTRKALKGMSMRKLTNNFAVAGGASPPPKDAWFPRGTPPKALAGTVPAADSGGPGLGKSRGGKHRRTKTHAALGAGGAEGQHVAMLMGPTVSKAKHQRARSGGSEGRGAGGRDVEREEGEAAREKDKEKKKKKKKKKPLTEVDKAVLRERTIRGNIQRKFLRIAAMNIIESGWIRFGSELATLFILLAAFASFSLLSFLMICLVVAMVTARTANPKHMSITYPIVAAGSVALIIFQYAVVMGWPPSHPDYRPPDWVDPYESPVPVPVVTSEQEHDILKDSVIKDDAIGRWLGVQRVEVATLWCLFFAVASVMNELILLTAVAKRQQESGDIEDPIKDIRKRVEILQQGLERDDLGMMWSKLSHSEFIYFTILDRTRYYLTLLLLEIVLVLVVVLSTVSQDVLHLLYVLLAIFLFRMRGTLRQSNESAASEPREGGQETSGATSTALLSLRALQAVNVLVILLVLAVQAPWEYLTYRSFRSFYGDGSCKVSEVFGLHKVSDASESLSLSRRGNLAEVLLFVLLRLLVIVRRTATFRSVVAVASRLELARARELLERSEAWKLKQAITAEATSKWRVQRRHRMRQLREAVMKVAYTGNPNPQELQALVSLLEGKHLNDTATAAQHRRNMSRPEALPSGAVTPTLPIQGGSVSQLRPRLRSVSVLAAGSNSNAVQRPAALEQCIKRAKLNGFTGNAHLDGCPGWDDSKREPSPSKDRFKVVRGGISKVAAGLSTMTMRYRKGATQKDPKAPQGGGAAPGHKRSRSAADGVESRAGSLARAEDWDAMGRSGKEGGSATGPGSVAGDNSEKDPKASLQRAQTRTMTDVKMMFSSEIGEPPSPFVRFGRWLMRHVRAFVKETDSRLLAACLLTGLLFTIDMGVLSAIVSASIVGYALVAERAGHAYWLAVQTYMEIMIIIDYLLQIFTSLKCNGFESYSYLSIDVSYSGLHQHPAKAIPLFLAYLSVLSYTSSFRIAQCFRKDANPAISREPTSGGPQSTALLERPGCDAGGRAVGGVEGLDGPGRKRLKVVLTGTRDGVCVVHRYQGEMDSAQRQDTARGRFGGGKGLTASEQARGLWSALVQEGMRGMMRALNFVESTATSSERRPFFARVIVALNTTSPPFPVEAKEDWDDDAARDMVEERVRESHERMETFLQKVLDTIREQQALLAAFKRVDESEGAPPKISSAGRAEPSAGGNTPAVVPTGGAKEFSPSREVGRSLRFSTAIIFNRARDAVERQSGMRPLRPQPSLRRSQLQLGDRQTSLRAQSVSESKEGADNADPPPRPGPVPLEALPPLGGNTGPDTPSNLVVGDWTPREHINLAKTGPLTVRVYRMEQVCNPAGISELPMPRKVRERAELPSDTPLLALMVEVLPHAAQSSPTGNRPTVHPSTDFIRAMLLAGRVAKLIDLAWLRSGAPQWMRDMLPMLEGLAMSERGRSKDTATLSYKMLPNPPSNLQQGLELTTSPPIPETDAPGPIARGQSRSTDGSPRAFLAPPESRQAAESTAPQSARRGGSLPPPVTAPSPIREAIVRGLQPRPKTPGRSEEEDSGSDDDLGQHDLPGYYFEGPGWSTPRWGTSTFYGSRNVSPAPKQPSLAAPQGMEPLTGVGFSRALPFPAAPQQARYSRRDSIGMDQPSRLQNDPDRERDFPVLASDVAKASPYVRADALQEDLSGGQVMRRRRSESDDTAGHIATPSDIASTSGAQRSASMSPSFNVGQSLTLDPRAQASNANAQSQEMTPKMEGGSGSPFRRCSGAMGGPEESPPYVRVAGGDDDVLLAISEASEFTEITPEKGDFSPDREAKEDTKQGPSRLGRTMTTSMFQEEDLREPEADWTGLPGAQVLHMEAHSREKQDFYPATVGFDFLSFIYVAIFFRYVIPTDADFANTGTSIVPLSYLLVLLVMFLLMVFDRMCYIMGSNFLKACLHYTQLVLITAVTCHVYWFYELKELSAVHIRIFLLLKGAALLFGALQLRCGYPEGSSYRNGIGRYSQFYHQFPNVVGWWIFAVTTSIPFVFELRHLLDWACTLTTLRFVDWLVIEDIHASLFLATFDRNIRHFRYVGRKEPSWRKILQGVVLFCALCALVWMPLVLFASNNPAFQTPAVRINAMNVTIGATVPRAPTADAVLTPDVSFKIPVFTGDFRWSSINWATASNKPPELSNFPEQAVKLLCVDPQSSTRWRITPPMKANLSALLEDPTAIVTVDFGWQLSRNDNSAGECQAQTSSRLSPETVDRLRGILNGTLTRTELSAEVPGDTDTPSTDTSAGGLYALFWRIGGSPCEVDTDYKGIDLLYSRRDKARLDGLTQEGEETASSLPILRADQQVFCDLELQGDGSGAEASWWAVYCGYGESRESAFSGETDFAQCSEENGFNGPQVVTLLDKISTGDVGAQLSSLSISGLYLGVVWAVGKFVRVAVTNMKLKIPYEQIPDPKRLRALIDDIYIARAEGDLKMEEELFWTLITIYRVPSVLFELTRKKLR